MPSTAQAAGYAGWSGHSVQPKRAQFRPWQPRSEGRTHARWRPHGTIALPRSVPRPQKGVRQPALLTGENRYAPSVSRNSGRSTNADLRFRPNGRSVAPPFDPTARDLPVGQSGDARLQAQFRPRPAKRRPTYEQLTYEQFQARPTHRLAWPSRVSVGAVYPGAANGLTSAGFLPTPWNAGW